LGNCCANLNESFMKERLLYIVLDLERLSSRP
jgi:hypothetical protein